MKRFFKSNRIYIFGAILSLALFSLRFVHLNILPVFADEAIYVRWAQVMRAEETLRFLPLSDGKEPLFMWAAIPFMKIISDPLVAGRMLSVVTGFASFIGVSLLSWLLFKSKKVTVVASIIYAASTFMFFFNRMALVDSMLSMFGIWTFIFAYLAVTKERLDCAMISGFCLGGAWLTKSPAIFFAIMIPTLWLFASFKKGRGEILLKVLKLAGLTLVVLSIGYGMYNILRLGPNYSMIAKRNLDYVWPISHILTSPFNPLITFLKHSIGWIWAMGPFGILFLAVVGIAINVHKFWKQIIILSIWFLVPIVIQSEYAKVFTARYILYSIPFLIVIAASSFNSTKKVWLRVSALLLILFLGQSLIFNKALLLNPEAANLPSGERSGYLEDWTAGQGISQTANYLIKRQAENPQEKIVVGTEGYWGTLPDGLQIYLNSHPEITVIGVGMNFSNLPPSLLESRNAGNATFLLINNDRFRGNPDKLGLSLVSEYPKATKPDGTHESLLFYELN